MKTVIFYLLNSIVGYGAGFLAGARNAKKAQAVEAKLKEVVKS